MQDRSLTDDFKEEDIVQLTPMSASLKENLYRIAFKVIVASPRKLSLTYQFAIENRPVSAFLDLE